ncbi:uncharacterized protein YbbC (DUF1343 family) [Tumebacillus sp. BK434]|uniref:exo-beta-N-acetylmuramidase NamZ family protein n=1 Tax=Tumebacillus sp. BK434 TaxID=2512169 RepID=UPI0010D42602|nr:DUF1343 domain-containing protein [Tumebacillus sp. BK434]TCP59229.1 uncharacterized protein YbbC (DUF1343 family) [Tumebacillus sp. BK434]
MIRIGIEGFFEEYLDQFRGSKVGLLSHLPAVDSQFVTSIDLVATHPDLQLKALFTPEHGLYGVAQAGEQIVDEIHPRYKVPIFSLYGTREKPTAKMLNGLDLLLIDFQDVGARFYTYISALGYMLEAAAEAGLPVFVLDRPNPVGGRLVEGPVLTPEHVSYVGRYPIPIRYGMTIGELSLWIAKQAQLSVCLIIVPMVGWQRSLWFDQTGRDWVPTSPNMPSLSTAIVYPGMTLFEGTNVTEGRGTTRPFEYFGAPWIEPSVLIGRFHEKGLPGVRLREVSFVPTFSKYKDEVCRGAQVHVTDREQFRPVRTAVHLLEVIKELYPDDLRWTDPVRGRHFIDLLCGTSELRAAIDSGQDITSLYEKWEGEAEAFRSASSSNFLYS